MCFLAPVVESVNTVCRVSNQKKFGFGFNVHVSLWFSFGLEK